MPKSTPLHLLPPQTNMPPVAHRFPIPEKTKKRKEFDKFQCKVLSKCCTEVSFALIFAAHALHCFAVKYSHVLVWDDALDEPAFYFAMRERTDLLRHKRRPLSLTCSCNGGSHWESYWKSRWESCRDRQRWSCRESHHGKIHCRESYCSRVGECA